MDTFKLNELPIAYFCDNPNSVKLRDSLLNKNESYEFNYDNLKKNNKKYNKSYEVNKHPEDVYDETKLKDMFFSDKNILCINNSVINILKKDYNVEIPLQSKQQIYMFCFSVWKFESCNLPGFLKEQINELNKKVIDKILPVLISSINQKIKYLEDINKPLNVMERPFNTSSNKSLESISNKILDKKNIFEY